MEVFGITLGISIEGFFFITLAIGMAIGGAAAVGGGGGGGVNPVGTIELGGRGGIGGGGDGGNTSSPDENRNGKDGDPNTGGGGGGSRNVGTVYNSGAGGSGLVVIRPRSN